MDKTNQEFSARLSCLILPLVQNKMTVTKMCANNEVSSRIDIGMIFWWHCRSVLSSLNVPNFSFHANKRKKIISF